MKVAILNNYLGTFGGGEKSTYAMASELSSMGFDVTVTTFENSPPTEKQIDSFFGDGHAGFSIKSLAPLERRGGSRDEVLREFLGDFTVFINHSASDVFVNPCPLGIYSVMFPFQLPGDYLKSYHHFVCNSEYSQRYAKFFWASDLNTTVVYPPGGDNAEAVPAASTQREREILSIGRFNWLGHKKNQDLLVDAFEKISDLLPKGWRLTLLGKTNDNRETHVALDRLKDRCQSMAVNLELDATEEQKRAALARASIYWHGTGIGKSEPADAAAMEHFGIAVVEAMAAGAIPICYHRGGPREILEHGVNGFLFRDLTELGTHTLYLATCDATQERFRQSGIERARLFSRLAFHHAFTSFVDSVILR